MHPAPLLAALLWLVSSTPALATSAQQFVDVTQSAGIDYLQHAGESSPDCIFGGFCEPGRITGGAAVGDVDGDGDVDLLVTRLDGHDLLFCNRLVETTVAAFEDCTPGSGLENFALQSNGAGFVDVDNDGDLDLFVGTLAAEGDTPNARNLLFINDGSGHFSEQAAARGVDGASASDRRIYGVAFGDFDRDGWIDLHTNEWLPGSPSHSRLLHNLGPTQPGHFEDVTAAAGVELDGVDAFASGFADLDGDGWPDLAVAADFGTSRLFWNDRDGSFTDGTAEAQVGTDENGMGSTFGDFDADGDLDWFVTSVFDPDDTCAMGGCNWGSSGNRLYRYEGSRLFSDATDDAGVRNGYWGWGASFFDADNDGDLDLAMTNGVDFESSIELAFHDDPMRFWENDGSGAMTEVSTARGLTDRRSGKGLLVFDYDADGDLDLLIVNNAGGPVLYRNEAGSSQDWLRVRIDPAFGASEGHGVRVILHTTPQAPPQLREIGAATHFLGQSERVAHFGLGSGGAAVHSLEVQFGAGRSLRLLDVARNQTLTVPALAAANPAALGAVLVTLAGLRRRRRPHARS